MASPLLTYLQRTFLELGDGFHFSSAPPSDITDERYLRSGDPWEVLACVLARLQRGQLQAVDVLVDLMRRHDDAGVWNACAQLIGFAGRRRLLADLATEYADQIQDRGVQIYVSTALVNGCGLWSVPHLLAMHASAMDDHARKQLECALSRLIEPEPGSVWSGPAQIVVVDDELPPPFQETTIELEHSGYAALIEASTAELQKTIGSDERLAIAEGRVFDTEQLAQTLLRRIRIGERSDRIEWERMLLEATTGLDCRGFFNEQYLLQPLTAGAIVETFLESGEAAKYQPGVRYFFGHRIPD